MTEQSMKISPFRTSTLFVAGYVFGDGLSFAVIPPEHGLRSGARPRLDPALAGDVGEGTPTTPTTIL